MEFDDRPDPAKRLEKARLARGFQTAKDAATYFGWSYPTYAQHEQGLRGIPRAAAKYAKAFRVSEGWLLTGEGHGPDHHKANENEVPLMGYVGAGAEVQPDFEQVPPDGLDQIHIPFPLPGEMIAFQISGDSMLPVYREGMVLIVYREQKRPSEWFFGREAVVRTEEGRRFVKTIMRGNPTTLYSTNAPPIENAVPVWLGEIFAILPRESLGNRQ